MFVLTPGMKLGVDPSLEQPPTNLADVIKSANAYIHNIISSRYYYQYVSIAFGIIIGVALQEYEEYNNLPY
jgi:hypothetical protein